MAKVSVSKGFTKSKAAFGGPVAGGKGKTSGKVTANNSGFGGPVKGMKMGKGGKAKMMAKKAANC